MSHWFINNLLKKTTWDHEYMEAIVKVEDNAYFKIKYGSMFKMTHTIYNSLYVMKDEFDSRYQFDSRWKIPTMSKRIERNQHNGLRFLTSFSKKINSTQREGYFIYSPGLFKKQYRSCCDIFKPQHSNCCDKIIKFFKYSDTFKINLDFNINITSIGINSTHIENSNQTQPSPVIFPLKIEVMVDSPYSLEEINDVLLDDKKNKWATQLFNINMENFTIINDNSKIRYHKSMPYKVENVKSFVMRTSINCRNDNEKNMLEQYMPNILLSVDITENISPAIDIYNYTENERIKYNVPKSKYKMNDYFSNYFFSNGTDETPPVGKETSPLDDETKSFPYLTKLTKLK
jgi:hypothetical protein